jgi:HD-like signal output (HDOD) protein
MKISLSYEHFKDFPTGPIRNKVETLIAPEVSGKFEKAMAARAKLPPFSPILNKLIASLTNEDVSFAEVAALIEKDAVLAGNVLRLVNSALYGCKGTINSVRHAVSLMGLAKVRNVAMSLSVARMWSSQGAVPNWYPGPFNLNAVSSAILADQIAVELPVEYPEGAFSAGLLANIGMMLIAIGLPGERDRIQAAYCGNGLVECEQEVLGFDHAKLSAAVLEQWNLPKPIQRAVATHHGPYAANSALTLGMIIEQVESVSTQLGYPAQPWLAQAPGRPEDALSQLGLGEHVLDNFKVEFDAVRGLFH